MTSAFVSAQSLDEALGAGGARPVAGGTDLVVGARQGKNPLPESIVAIHRIEELRGLATSDGRLRLGALVTHEEIAADPAVRERLTALADASAIVPRHQGAGNGRRQRHERLARDGARGPLMVFGAEATLRSASGERRVPLTELLTGPARPLPPRTSSSRPPIPLPPDGSGSCYARLEYRRQMEIAVVGATAAVTLAGGTVEQARLAITALAPTIRLVPEAEEALVGSDAGAEAVQAAAQAAARAAEPISDVRASADYRRAMAEVLARRADGRRGARPRRGDCDSGQLGLFERRREDPRDAERERHRLRARLAPSTTLLYAVRDAVGLTGAKEGCDDSGVRRLHDAARRQARERVLLSRRAGGRARGDDGRGPRRRRASPRSSARSWSTGVQCGFCTPGMLISATALLEASPSPSEDEVRIALGQPLPLYRLRRDREGCAGGLSRRLTCNRTVT